MVTLWFYNLWICGIRVGLGVMEGCGVGIRQKFGDDC